MKKRILIIATLDTKEEEALFLKERIEARGHRVLIMDTGILKPPKVKPDIDQEEVARRGGIPLKGLLATGNKGECVANMIRGAQAITRELYNIGVIDGVISVGGAQGTEIACAAMRELPTGVPKLMVSTVASGRATFGPYVGTKDLVMMHSVADIQGINFLTREIFIRAAGAICGMVEEEPEQIVTQKVPVALSMLGTTTPGAMRVKALLEPKGFELVAFHQNGTGGIAMEGMIAEGRFKAVLDLNLHEIADREFGGLHGAISPTRLETAGALGLPQVVAPGSINYYILGPLETLPQDILKRKHLAHNPNLTIVRATPGELIGIAQVVARKLNQAKGPVHVLIPLKGFCSPDREGHEIWEPEGNLAFIETLKKNLNPSIPLTEVDAHINDPEFVDPVVACFMELVPPDQ